MGLYLIPPYSAYFGMRWQRFVGSLDRQVTEVSFAKESYKRDLYVAKEIRSLSIVATAHMKPVTHLYVAGI